MPRPRLSSIFSFQINPSFQLQPLQWVSDEDLQYLDEVSANMATAASNANMSNPPFADSSNYISGNFSTTTQAVMVEVLGSTVMAGIGTTPSNITMCNFSAVKVTTSCKKSSNLGLLYIFRTSTIQSTAGWRCWCACWAPCSTLPTSWCSPTGT